MADSTPPPADTASLATLLVVDDEPLMTNLFSQSMTKRGFRVLTASSGQEALARVAEEPLIRLVITDMTMPDMDGVAVARALAQTRADLPVIIATGHHATLEDSGLPPNVRDIVQKPYQARDLAERIRRLLDSNPI